MKALVKSHAQRGLWIEDVPEPQVGINDVKIRVLVTGICGTDLHIYEWDTWAEKTIPVPLVIGHEFVGEIVEIGSNVSDFHIGDLVSGEGHDYQPGGTSRLVRGRARTPRLLARSGRRRPDWQPIAVPPGVMAPR